MPNVLGHMKLPRGHAHGDFTDVNGVRCLARILQMKQGYKGSGTYRKSHNLHAFLNIHLLIQTIAKYHTPDQEADQSGQRDFFFKCFLECF